MSYTPSANGPAYELVWGVNMMVVCRESCDKLGQAQRANLRIAIGFALNSRVRVVQRTVSANTALYVCVHGFRLALK